MGTTRWLAIGIDPGPTTGIVALHWFEYDWPIDHVATLGRPDIVQCNAEFATDLLRLLLEPARRGRRCCVGIETFVVRSRAARSSSAVAGRVTRELVANLTALAESSTKARVFQRSAAEVKPWATDERLDAAGLLTPTKGIPHARDAVRHALFASSHDFGLTDPLSRKGRGG